MRPRSVLGIAVLIVCTLALTVPGLSAQAGEKQDSRGNRDHKVSVCNLRSGKIIEVARSAAKNSPIFTGDLARCTGGSENPTDQLAGGILATFDVDGEQFRVWVTNPTTIQQIFDLQAGTSMANIPNGIIHYGSGQGNHNAPWSWYLDPEQIEMADMTIEVCDARPSYVEEEVKYFVDVVGRYCPWGATLVSIEDYR